MPLNSNQISHIITFDEKVNNTSAKKSIRQWMKDFSCISWEFTEEMDYNKLYSWEEFHNTVIPKLKRSILSDITFK